MQKNFVSSVEEQICSKEQKERNINADVVNWRARGASRRTGKMHECFLVRNLLDKIPRGIKLYGLSVVLCGWEILGLMCKNPSFWDVKPAGPQFYRQRSFPRGSSHQLQWQATIETVSRTIGHNRLNKTP